MSGTGISKREARYIADAASECADKALYWKARAQAAEEALSKVAGETYANHRVGGPA
jgi:hypothetical protein